MLFTGSSYPLANQYSMSVLGNLMSKKIPIVLHLTILLMLLFFGLPAAKAQQRRQVIIDHAGEMRNLKKDGREVRRLIGDVIMRHEDITMKCDSAYEYVGENRFDAYGRVVIVQEDSRLYGDSLHYDGNKKVGRVRGKLVRLVDKDAEAITNYLISIPVKIQPRFTWRIMASTIQNSHAAGHLFPVANRLSSVGCGIESLKCCSIPIRSSITDQSWLIFRLTAYTMTTILSIAKRLAQ